MSVYFEVRNCTQCYAAAHVMPFQLITKAWFFISSTSGDITRTITGDCFFPIRTDNQGSGLVNDRFTISAYPVGKITSRGTSRLIQHHCPSIAPLRNLVPKKTGLDKKTKNRPNFAT